MKARSIKLRLSVAVTLIVAVLSGVAGAGILSASRNIRMISAWAAIEDAARDASDEVETEAGALEVDDDIRWYRDGVSILIYDVRGACLAGTAPVTFPKDTPLAPGQNRVIGAWLVRDVVAEDDASLAIRAVMSSAGMRADARALSLCALAAWLMLIAGVACGAYLAARRAARPLDDIDAGIRHIESGDDLAERLDVPESCVEAASLARSFNIMLERLEAAFDKERRFTSDASHELRTPVAVIMAQCEDGLRSDGARREESLKTVLSQAEHMSRLIGQLLLLSRSDRHAIQPRRERVNMSLLAESIADEAEGGRVRVERDITRGVCVSGDETLIVRAMLNLTENAARYCDPAKDDPYMRVVLRKTPDAVLFSVEDNGMGIDGADVPRVWDRFFRADKARGMQDGFGLGLPLTRAIMRAHGGDATATSVPGEGSVLTLRFPVEPPR